MGTYNTLLRGIAVYLLDEPLDPVPQQATAVTLVEAEGGCIEGLVPPSVPAAARGLAVPWSLRGSLQRLLFALVRCDAIPAAMSDALEVAPFVAEAALPVELLIDLCALLEAKPAPFISNDDSRRRAINQQLRRISSVVPGVALHSRDLAVAFTGLLVSSLASLCCAPQSSPRSVVAEVLTPDVLRGFVASRALASIQRASLGESSSEDKLSMALLCAVCLADPISSDILFTQEHLLNALCHWAFPLTPTDGDSHFKDMSQQVMAICIVASTIASTEYGSPISAQNLATITHAAVKAARSEMKRVVDRYVEFGKLETSDELQALRLLGGLLIPLVDMRECLSYFKTIFGQRLDSFFSSKSGRKPSSPPPPIWSGDRLDSSSLLAPLCPATRRHLESRRRIIRI